MKVIDPTPRMLRLTAAEVDLAIKYWVGHQTTYTPILDGRILIQVEAEPDAAIVALVPIL